ncbi:alpha-beta hydrolase superfamily lysophospholipase, partial [Deinococcus metalli]
MKQYRMLALVAGLAAGSAHAGGAGMPMQQGMLNVNGAQIHYVSEGTGTPILLLHGYPLSGELFARNRDALTAAGYRVITIDHRGYGQSVAPA